jgi:hypothetical protein
MDGPKEGWQTNAADGAGLGRQLNERVFTEVNKYVTNYILTIFKGTAIQDLYGLLDPEEVTR